MHIGYFPYLNSVGLHHQDQELRFTNMIKGIFVQETNPSDNIAILLCLRGAALWNRLHDLLLCFVQGLQLWLPHPCKSMVVKVWVWSPHTVHWNILSRT